VSDSAIFMKRLHIIMRARLNIRDVLILYVVANNPGINKLDAAQMLGFESHSGVRESIKKCLARGFIEDKRRASIQSMAASMHVLPAGQQFLRDLLS
jgi:predicted transcriptional regulator